MVRRPSIGGIKRGVVEKARTLISVVRRREREGEMEKALREEELKPVGEMEKYRRKKAYVVWFSHGWAKKGKLYDIRREIAVYGWEADGQELDLRPYLETAVDRIFNGGWSLGEIESLNNATGMSVRYESEALTGQTSERDDGNIDVEYTLRRNFGRSRPEFLNKGFRNLKKRVGDLI